ncbi:pentatricopeptide repeat-containing protein At2g13600-like [Selaginella moellendorffii]|uniref:pentatricopeptide repeat-containing protein At2g13600-like n=1 Tax=Selaginella moellendorffii TaxID=88036 RepID=UPI000D1CCCF0|nr:pentatricopeptide repeat-containing protein At2g13600-like [Selaginella moellendorffii]|eukprot:XP_024536529.1 pentatricopeptide repeat-containing protein At2g13600-like [Selaginella moellendorffii]
MALLDEPQTCRPHSNREEGGIERSRGRQKKLPTNIPLLLNTLKACTSTKDLERGRRIHSEASKAGADTNIFVASKLVEMYAKCGSTADARTAFDKVHHPDVVLWNVLVLGHADNGEGDVALDLLQQMQASGCEPNSRTFVAAVKACSTLAANEEATQVGSSNRMVKVRALKRGMKVHARAASGGFDTDIFVANTLLDMYSKCGNMAEARKIFDGMAFRDAVSWNCLISGYAEHREDLEEALQLFVTMVTSSDCECDHRSFVAALKACAGIAAASREEATKVSVNDMELARKNSFLALERGMAIHARACLHGWDSNIFVANTLVDLYVKCGRMVEAHGVFDRTEQHDVVSWNILLLGYAESKSVSSSYEVLRLFSAMQAEARCQPDARTFVALLKACSTLASEEQGAKHGASKQAALDKGMAIHSQVIKHKCESDSFVCSSLVEMYSKCGCMDAAYRVFDGVKQQQRGLVLWNTLILGYAENGQAEQALHLFERMITEQEISPDSRTFVAALKACTGLVAAASESSVEALNTRADAKKLAGLERCMALHAAVAKTGFDKDLFVSSSLVDLYGKCGSMSDARMVFDGMPVHSSVSWNSLILGYTDNGQERAAYEVFVRMIDSQEAGYGSRPDCRTLVAVLKACGNAADLQAGKAVHASACKAGLDSEALVVTGLVDFYGKCGSTDAARRVFDSAEARGTDSVAWTALIAGYSREGETKLALELFREMASSRSRPPDGVTFLAILSACGRAGLVDAGREIFQGMVAASCSSGEVVARIEHYHCMVDLLGRANELEEAMLVAETMPFEAGVETWTSLLAACCKWKNVELAVLAFERVMALDRGLAAAYVLMASLYESLGLWEDQSRMLLAMEANGFSSR